SVIRSIGRLRSDRPIILSKIRRCASRKKSSALMTSVAWLKAWLLTRTAPRTPFSASRLCGRVRSMEATRLRGYKAARLQGCEATRLRGEARRGNRKENGRARHQPDAPVGSAGNRPGRLLRVGGRRHV